MEHGLYSAGDVAREVGLTPGALQYRLRTRQLPDASYRVAGRRVFTAEDVQNIHAEVQSLRRAQQSLS